MRIGIDVRPSQVASSGARGLGKYVLEVVEGVVRMAPENKYVLLAYPDLPLPERLQSLPSCCCSVPVPTRRIESYPWAQPVKRVWRLRYLNYRREHARSLERVARQEKLDVVHFPCAVDGTYFPDGDPGCRVVKTMHDFIPLVFEKQIMQQWPEARRFVYGLQVRSLSRADVVVAISQATREDVLKYTGVSPDKIRVVNNSVSDEFSRVSDEARLKACYEKYGICHTYFLYCSGSGFNKNRERIVRAFGQFAEEHPEPFHLVFVGPKEAEEINHLKSVGFEVGLTRRQFVVTGFVPDADLATLYSGAQALIMPSLYEGFGFPVVQAMRSGTPVIASDRSSHPEVVGEAGLLVDPYSVEAIAQAMGRLAGDPALRKELSARGLERARRFDWRNQAKSLLEIYTGD